MDPGGGDGGGGVAAALPLALLPRLLLAGEGEDRAPTRDPLLPCESKVKKAEDSAWQVRQGVWVWQGRQGVWVWQGSQGVWARRALLWWGYRRSVSGHEGR